MYCASRLTSEDLLVNISLTALFQRLYLALLQKCLTQDACSNTDVEAVDVASVDPPASNANVHVSLLPEVPSQTFPFAADEEDARALAEWRLKLGRGEISVG